MELSYNSARIALISFFLFCILLEFSWARRTRKNHLYSFSDSFHNFGAIILNQSSGVLFTLLNVYGVSAIYGIVAKNGLQLFSTEWNWTSFVLLFIAQDFLYYWVHRLSHRVNWLWSAHVVHHSSKYLNLTTGLRHSLLYAFTGVRFFWLPLAYLGWSQSQVVTIVFINLAAQFFSHTQAIGKLGFLEHIFVTPSHHRVHHGINMEYRDKNFSGVFIVWDKIFGTFAEGQVAPVYGTTKALRAPHLTNVMFQDFIDMVKMCWHRKGLKNKIMTLVGPPDWEPKA